MRGIDKILSVTELASVLASLRADGKTVVQCHGCFDLLHIGHIRYLQKAARLGDILVVTVTPDRYVNKGPHRPAFPESLRAESVAALDCVDYVAINEWPTAVECIALLKPTFYAKGAEYRDNRTPEILREEVAIAESGGEVAFIEDITSSSSQLINRHLLPFSEEVGLYLTHLSETYGPGRILEWVEKAQSLKVLVVGEAIIDEICSCKTLQRSAHAPVLAAQYLSQDRFVGGAAAVANNLASFCGEVGLLSLVGAQQSEEDWLRSQLQPNVRPTLVRKTDAPTTVRRQYRESYFALPIFELYIANDDPLTESDEQGVCQQLAEMLPHYDLVLAADCGHTMLTPKAIELFSDGARYLSVNTQIDAANVGYHTVGRYPRADYICLAEQELRLECRSPHEEVGPLLQQVAGKLSAPRAVVMRGSRGCVGFDGDGNVLEAPALATNVVDRSGATEAFFAITSLCAYLKAPLELTCFLGNIAGAEAVATLGTNEPLSKLPLRRHVEALLK